MLLHYCDLAWRNIKQTPFVSMLMIIAIGIGIGVTMTTLSVYHMMSADPIAHKSDKLHAVQLQVLDDGYTWRTEDDVPLQLTYPDAKYLLENSPLEKRVAMLKSGAAVHIDRPDSVPFIEGLRVTSRHFFELFDVPFLHGNVWSESQSKQAALVVVISEGLANKLFGKTDVLGESIYLGERLHEVVGVTKTWLPTVKFYDVNNDPFEASEQVFVPFTHIEAYKLPSWGNTNGWKSEDINSFEDFLNSETVWLQFWVEFDSESQKRMYGQFVLDYMTEQQKLGRFNRKELDYNLKTVPQWLKYNYVVSSDNKILVGLSFMFLAVCVANILGLLLAKFMKRAPDAGVRRALGASKTQIFSQHLVEVALLGLLGSIVGVLLAQVGLAGIRGTMSGYDLIAIMDWKMLLIAPVISILACLIAGLFPAWVVCKTSPATHLKVQ
ncbi:ABC transporter permease [Pseudoalteromonas umbrosa]|uniref:ABC transporter permease n=1 Tax=Pseudoalteromonas umbrosa TaxID=3048489 RepID=UPI0024C35FD6|nr:ABC transporter permease [Pseudoalteromonas sp. B95]MDK1285897.1 ABC transporter permease [Pseudoalteromonas sp. B95]